MAMNPIKLDKSQFSALMPELEKQTTSTSRPRSADPNYPVFQISPGEYVLVYVPNHITVDSEGKESLRMDTPILYPVEDGSYSRYRSTQGIDLGDNNGLCAFTEARNEGYRLANELIDREFARLGMQTSDTSDEAKAIKRSFYQKMPIGAPSRYYTFPVVVIESQDPTDLRGARKPKIVNNSVVTRTYWMTMSENQWSKMTSALENLEEPVEHPGGQFLLFNYTDTGKNPNASEAEKRRESGRNMKIQLVPTQGDSWPLLAEKFNKDTEDWDAYKAVETLYANMFYPYEDSVALCSKLLEPLRLEAEMSTQLTRSGTPAVKGAIAAQMGIAETPEVTSAQSVDGLVDEPDAAPDFGDAGFQPDFE